MPLKNFWDSILAKRAKVVRRNALYDCLSVVRTLEYANGSNKINAWIYNEITRDIRKLIEEK